MFAENNNGPKNEPQTRMVWRKMKLCLVLCIWLLEKYNSQQMLAFSLDSQRATQLYPATQLATQRSYCQFCFFLFVFGISLLQLVAKRAAKLLQLLELASQPTSIFVHWANKNIQPGWLRTLYFEKNTTPQGLF